MNKAGEVIVSIVAAIIGLATIAVIISRNSRAPEAIQALASAIANIVRAAVTPSNNDGSLF